MPKNTPRSRLLCGLLLLPLASCGIFPKTSQERRKPTDEELLELYTTTATFLYEDGSLVRAQDQAVKALEIDPEHRAMRRMVGWIRLRMGKTQDLLIARGLFEELREDADEHEGTTLGLATTLERLGLGYDQAARHLASPTAVAPDGETIEGLTARARELWGESVELYASTMVDGEGSTNAMNGMQRVHALLGNYEESLAWSDRLLERSGEELALWDQMLQAKSLTEKEEVLFHENRRIAMRLRLETHLFASTLLNDLGRTEEAIAHLDHVVEDDPQLPQAYSLRAQLHAGRGEYRRAIEDLDRYLGLSEEPHEHPDVRRAFDLKTHCELELAQVGPVR